MLTGYELQETNIMTLLDRIRSSLQSPEINKSTIAQMVGISTSALEDFIAGKTDLSGTAIEQLITLGGLELRPQRSSSLLPLEEQATDGICQEFADEFEFACDVLRFGLKVIGNTPSGPGTFKVTKPRGLANATVHLALGLFAKACKQFRGIIALCEMGLPKEAGAIERCLFEAILAMNFILRPRIVLKENKVPLTKLKPANPYQCPKCGHTEPARQRAPLKTLSTDMRRTLYLAHDLIGREKELDSYLQAGLTDLAKTLGDEKILRKMAANARRRIGPGWVERQKRSRKYSGVSISDLAQSYDLDRYYISLYKRHSRVVHALDGHDFIGSAKGNQLLIDLGPSSADIKQIMFFSTTFFGAAIELVNDRLGLGVGKEVRSLCKELKQRRKALVEGVVSQRN
jgi:hypothetical protein